jgi:hypothetical protein
LKNFTGEKLVELKNEAQNILILFGDTVHHLSKEDMRRAIIKLANGQVELMTLLIQKEMTDES